MNDPLNPTLYRLLKRRFGVVKIANEGEAQIGRYVEGLLTGEMTLELSHPGEYYMVNCPFCSDTKFRLYINHMWGKKDVEGNNNLWLAICYNETRCLDSYDRRLSLLDEVTALESELRRARIHKGKEINLDDVRSDWPGPVTRVDLLPEDHPAKQYLRSRRFDPGRIGRFYDVRYCHDSFRWLAKDRLIIPVYENRVLRGYQARYIGEIDWKKPGAPPKYYTSPGMPRRLLIYNLANASRYRTGVIVEGPTDVWSFGPMACCTLGATMTVQQQRRFISQFRDHAAILLFDPEEYQKATVQKLIASLSGKFARGFAPVILPAGRDPGNLERRFMHEYVAQEARKHGVKVSWSLR